MQSGKTIGKYGLAAAILALAAIPASAWAEVYCYYFRWSAIDVAHLAVLQAAPEPNRMADFNFRGELTSYLPGAGFAAIWIAGMVTYAVWARRSVVGILLALVPIIVFAYGSWEMLAYAYPVCNAF